MLTERNKKTKLSKRRSTSEEIQGLAQEQLQSNFSVVPRPPAEQVNEPPKQEDFVAKAARAAQIALQGHNISIPAPGLPHLPPLPTLKQHTHQQPVRMHSNFRQYTPPSQSPRAAQSRPHQPPDYGPLPNLPHVSQTAPTQVLYERARQAATSKTSSSSRRAGLPSQRRPWTTEEENALMAGLDRVRGPHWSQILAMFGPGGTINESLKDRNQVQLKDKARNLKLFFLKSGIEVPYYLKYVTGDLKTRAPGQASKHEARERERQQGEEDKAHFNGVQGIMALAGANHALQSNQILNGDQEPNGEDQVPIITDLQNFHTGDPALGTGDGGDDDSGNDLGSENGINQIDVDVDINADGNLDPNLESIMALPETGFTDNNLDTNEDGEEVQE